MGCFLVYLFLGVFLLKNAKEMCMCVWVTNRIVTCEKYFFQSEWEYKRISGPGSPKTYCC